jgi:tetratricopeptide (TPR) repeat protein
LVKAGDGFHLWSDTYDRVLDDIFAVQDDIAQSVVKELRTALLGDQDDSDASGEAKAEVANAAKGRATDPEAYRLYLEARNLIGRLTREDGEKGLKYLEQALTRDPDFALAWAELGEFRLNQANWGWISTTDGILRAREALDRALSLEPDLAEAHATLALLQMQHLLDF